MVFDHRGEVELGKAMFAVQRVQVVQGAVDEPAAAGVGVFCRQLSEAALAGHADPLLEQSVERGARLVFAELPVSGGCGVVAMTPLVLDHAVEQVVVERELEAVVGPARPRGEHWVCGGRHGHEGRSVAAAGSAWNAQWRS